MTKINFTKEHQVKLYNLALKALFNNEIFNNTIGGTLSIHEVLHTTTINTLVTMKQNVDKKITTRETADEWSMTDREQEILAKLKEQSELLNLIIGWKKYSQYLDEVRIKKEKLNKELEALKESQKTPEDKIKELETEIASLEE